MSLRKMNELISKIYTNIFSDVPCRIRELGRGCYGIAYLVEGEKSDQKVVIKTYTSTNFSQQEALTLRLFADAKIPAPKVFAVWNATKDIPCNAIVMEYINGVNGAQLGSLSQKQKQNIAESVVETLLKIHNCQDKNGFGEVDKSERYATWNEFYRILSKKMFDNIRKAFDRKEVSFRSLETLEKALDKFDDFFDASEKTAPSLIHGDYNMSNIMISRHLNAVAAVIDPICSVWGDRELDLFQLDSGCGKEFGLMDIYAANMCLSKNFANKTAFYKAFAEFNHYARMQEKEDSFLTVCIDNLRRTL